MFPFPNNINVNFAREKFFGRKKELTNLNDILRRMATRTHEYFDICTITGIGGQGKVYFIREYEYITETFLSFFGK